MYCFLLWPSIAAAAADGEVAAKATPKASPKQSFCAATEASLYDTILQSCALHKPLHLQLAVISNIFCQASENISSVFQVDEIEDENKDYFVWKITNLAPDTRYCQCML